MERSEKDAAGRAVAHEHRGKEAPAWRQLITQRGEGRPWVLEDVEHRVTSDRREAVPSEREVEDVGLDEHRLSARKPLGGSAARRLGAACQATGQQARADATPPGTRPQ